MHQPIVYIDRSRIRPGKVEELRAAIDDLVRFIDEREPQLLQYAFYVDEPAGRMTVVAVHPDPESVELHLEVGREAFRGFADLLEMDGIEVYGTASDRMRELLEEKAAMLGDRGTVAITEPAAGFSRLQHAAR